MRQDLKSKQHTLDKLLRLVQSPDVSVEDLEEAMRDFEKLNEDISVIIDQTINGNVTPEDYEWFGPDYGNPEDELFITFNQLQDENDKLYEIKTELIK